MEKPKVYVITATVGTIDLRECIKSVQRQDYGLDNIEHILVCDGKEYEERVRREMDDTERRKSIELIVLPWNSGRNKFICHKIYASIPHLLHEPCLVMFLDEDNTILPNHISSLVETIQNGGHTWAYSLRNIVGKDGRFICRDACESLGSLSPTWVSLVQEKSGVYEDYLVDTSCYLVPVEVLRQFSVAWQRQARTIPEADRLFYKCLSKEFPNFGCSMKYTLQYKIENREDSVKADFFRMGNGIMKQRYDGNIPWDVEEEGR